MLKPDFPSQKALACRTVAIFVGTDPICWPGRAFFCFIVRSGDSREDCADRLDRVLKLLPRLDLTGVLSETRKYFLPKYFLFELKRLPLGVKSHVASPFFLSPSSYCKSALCLSCERLGSKNGAGSARDTHTHTNRFLPVFSAVES